MKMPAMGPAVLVTAAFIGPGTVITASLAGAHYGFALAWALLFSVLATIVLQEMAARLGIISGRGLGENIRLNMRQPLLRGATIALVIGAVVIGNSAYQGGNISGASLGLDELIAQPALPGLPGVSLWPIVIGVLAGALLWSGSYRLIEKALVVLVALMSLAFLLTLIIVQPDYGSLFHGLLVPGIPHGATLTVIALIGTTVVPYNLFLHTATAAIKWQHPDDIVHARQDLYFAIPLGGLISIAILATAATAFFGRPATINSVADLAPSLEPLMGSAASVLMATGLLAAGISSAVTAPLAAAYALSGVLDLDKNLNARSFRSIWLLVLIIGVTIASLGYRPVAVIWFAQVANGILLPVMVVFLLWLMNTALPAPHRNNALQNVMGAVVLIVSLLLSGRSLMSAFGLL